MIKRRIRGAKGDLYTHMSDAAHLAGMQLSPVFEAAGYKIRKKAPTEATIAAYPVKFRSYPLLNPRFKLGPIWKDGNWQSEKAECLEIEVLTKNAPASFQQALDSFEPASDCAFWPKGFTQNGFLYHGAFVLPVRFIGSGSTSEIDFMSLSPPLRRLRSFLAANEFDTDDHRRGVTARRRVVRVVRAKRKKRD